MSVFFSSDFHLNHENIAGAKCSKWGDGFRTFDCKEDMTEHIIEQINKTVKQEDTLYFLGDFCFGDHKLTRQWREKIDCDNIILIRGNHDKHIDLYQNAFPNRYDYLFTSVNKQPIVFSHYPILSWEGMGRGSWMIHGHCHGHENIDKLNESCKRLDVGIDSAYKIFGEYRPFSFEEVKAIMDAKSADTIDHHKIVR